MGPYVRIVSHEFYTSYEVAQRGLMQDLHVPMCLVLTKLTASRNLL